MLTPSHLVPPGLMLRGDDSKFGDRLPFIFGTQRDLFDRVSHLAK